MRVLAEGSVRLKGVAGLVARRRTVLVEAYVGIGNVKTNLTGSHPDSVVGELGHLFGIPHFTLPNPVEKCDQSSGGKLPFCVETFSGKLNL